MLWVGSKHNPAAMVGTHDRFPSFIFRGYKSYNPWLFQALIFPWVFGGPRVKGGTKLQQKNTKMLIEAKKSCYYMIPDTKIGGCFTCFKLLPLPGDDHMILIQMGWFNHQLEKFFNRFFVSVNSGIVMGGFQKGGSLDVLYISDQWFPPLPRFVGSWVRVHEQWEGNLFALHNVTATYRDVGPNFEPYRRWLLYSTTRDHRQLLP